MTQDNDSTSDLNTTVLRAKLFRLHNLLGTFATLKGEDAARYCERTILPLTGELADAMPSVLDALDAERARADRAEAEVTWLRMNGQRYMARSVSVMDDNPINLPPLDFPPFSLTPPTDDADTD